MYALAADLLEKYNLPFDVMLPLIDETARKVHELAPRDAQTGPAVRYDENVMNNHLAMLVDSPEGCKGMVVELNTPSTSKAKALIRDKS